MFGCSLIYMLVSILICYYCCNIFALINIIEILISNVKEIRIILFFVALKEIKNGLLILESTAPVRSLKAYANTSQITGEVRND